MKTAAPQMQTALTRAWAWLKKPTVWVNLIYAAMKAGLYEAGHYYDTNKGIIKGSPLSKEFTFLGYRFQGATAMVEVAPQTISKSLARVTSLLEQQVLTKERLEKHVQGFVNLAKGGLHGLIDPVKAYDALMTELEKAEVWLRLENQKDIKHKKWGKLWVREYWP